MADENDADDQFPRAVDDDVDTSFVTAALAGLDFLRPDTDDSAEPMPDWAWARVASVLAAQQPAPARRPSRLVRWGGGLAAASVAVVAVGVGVTAFQDTGSGGAVVAGADLAEAGAPAIEAADLAAANPLTNPLAKELAASRELSFASMVPPVFRLIDSQTPYTAADLKEQVAQVMSSHGMPASTEAVELTMASSPDPVVTADVPADGFTSTAQSLRDCVTKLTSEPRSTALMVDRSTFEGDDAGVIVTPEQDGSAADPSDPMDELEVMVVDPDCNLIMKVWIGLTR